MRPLDLGTCGAVLRSLRVIFESLLLLFPWFPLFRVNVVFENDTLCTNFKAPYGDIHDIILGRLIPDYRGESQRSTIKNRVKNGALDFLLVCRAFKFQLFQ